jgi:CHRD domain/Bacterial Ig domain
MAMRVPAPAPAETAAQPCATHWRTNNQRDEVMHAHSPLLAKFLIASGAALAALLAACGGYGGNYSMTGAGPGATCGGTYSVACPPPSVSLSAPAANATLSGTVTLSAVASASSTYKLTVASVNFEVDGASVGTAMSAPFSVMWDSTKVANGNHTLTAIVTDSANDTMTSTPVTVMVQNAAAAAAVMGPEQLFPAPASKASGMARLTVRADSGVLSGTVTLSGMNATAVTLHEGFAGSSGEALLALAPRAGHAGEWQVPANTTLSATQVSALDAGRLYLLATSSAHPEGEIRGQLAPGGVEVTFSELSLSPEAAALGVTAAGVAAATLDARAGTLTVHVSSAGIDDASAAQLSGSTGAQLAALARDPLDMGHFSIQATQLRAAQVADFRSGRLSVSVAASSLPEGALRGAIGPAP